MEADIGHEAFESSSHRRQQTSAPPPVLLSLYIFIIEKLLSSGLIVKEELHLVTRNSWKYGPGLSLNPHLIRCGVSCAISTLTSADSSLSSFDTA